MPSKKHTDEMIADALREAGTLVLVFAPLFEIFESRPHNWTILFSLLAAGVGLLFQGILVERRRDD